MPRPDRLDAYRKQWKTCMTNLYWSTHRLDKPNATKVDCSAHHEALKAIEGWAEVDATKLECKDISGRTNDKTFRVTAPEGSEPLTLVMHVNTVAEGDDTESAERVRDAQKAMAEVCPQRLSAEDNLAVVIEADGGNAVSAEKTHKDFAELLANVHKVDPAWFDPHKEKIVAKVAGLAEATAGAPCWWFGLHPVMLSKLSEDKVKELAADFVEPLSEFGKKVVTCHGDFHKGNVLEKADKTLCVIDCEFAYAGFAVTDIAYHFLVNAYTPVAKKEFVEAYLKGCGQEEAVEDETNKLLYDIEMQGLRAAYLSAWLNTENAMEKNKNYKGEIWVMMKEFETKTREEEGGAELQKKVVDNGVWVAATNAMTEEQKKSWGKFKDLYSGDGGSCCACTIM